MKKSLVPFFAPMMLAAILHVAGGTVLAQTKTLTFDDIPFGTQFEQFSPNAEVSISAFLRYSILNEDEISYNFFNQPAYIGFGPHEEYESQAIWVGGGWFGNSHRARIETNFLQPVSQFIVDVHNCIYSSILVYHGFSASGAPIQESIWFDTCPPDPEIGIFQRINVAAPAGGFLTSFHYEDYDESPVTLAMDNLTYTIVPEPGVCCLALLGGGLMALLRRKV